MNNTTTKAEPQSQLPEVEETQREASPSVVGGQESRRWWIKLFVQPLLLLAAGAALIVGLGVAQRLGWISNNQTMATKRPAKLSRNQIRMACLVGLLFIRVIRRSPGRNQSDHESNE